MQSELLVLVFVNLPALAVGFAIQLALVLFGEMPVVRCHVFLLVVHEALLALFQPCSLPRRELIVLDAICNAILLILFALVDLVHARMIGIIDAGARA